MDNQENKLPINIDSYIRQSSDIRIRNKLTLIKEKPLKEFDRYFIGHLTFDESKRITETFEKILDVCYRSGLDPSKFIFSVSEAFCCLMCSHAEIGQADLKWLESNHARVYRMFKSDQIQAK